MIGISQKPIDMKFFLLFIPVAFASYLFHELGHWSVGEILGNRMAYSQNYVWAKDGHFVHASDQLYSSIGGPAFSILQSAFALLVIEKYKPLYAYPFAFFPTYSRFFSLCLGGFSKQDEAWISASLGIGTYTVATIVLVILLSIVLWCSFRLKVGIKDNSYVLVASTVCQLLVIGTYKWMLS
jgi:hypothetical protein